MAIRKSSIVDEPQDTEYSKGKLGNKHIQRLSEITEEDFSENSMNTGWGNESGNLNND